MLCPICKTTLVLKDQGYYETLGEHVSNPNGYPSLKDGWGCPNEACPANKDNLSWLSDGEGPYHEKIGIEYPYINNNSGPFGSYQRKSNVAFPDYFKKKRLWVNLWAFKLVFEWKLTGDEEGNIVTRRIHCDLITRKNTMYTSGIHMFFYCMNNLHSNFARWQITGSKWDLKTVLEYVDPEYQKWDKRWWKRLVKWYAKKKFGYLSHHIPRRGMLYY
jgi:uncharacterized protein YbaR (Trm112 family)